VGKGHTYWHVVSALDGHRGPEVLYVGEGRKEKNLNKFWRWFGKKRASAVLWAVMDTWKAFIGSFKNHCPHVSFIYDKFHLIRHLLNALNTVRKQVLRSAGKQMRGVLAGKKFILLSRQAHVRGNRRIALNQLLNMSRQLFKAHLLKESFSHLWTYQSKTWARKFWQSWKDSLKWSRLKSYQKFAHMIDRHLDGIMNYYDHPVLLGFIEATNLKARNIIRQAYGYRDKAYMKLKIIQACSSLREFRPWLSSFNNSS
jgi:transposase